MEAGKRNIADLFNQGRTLEIPFFQRSYVWTDENWERFLNDMEVVSDDNRSYFMGSVILKSREVSSDRSIGDCRIVVDGQQRLSTIVLFCKALCEAQKNNEEIFERTFYNRRDEIILKHNHTDFEIFESIVNGELTDAIKQKYRNSSILKCYHYFKDKEKILRHINIDTSLDRLYVVGIDLGADEDE